MRNVGAIVVVVTEVRVRGVGEREDELSSGEMWGGGEGVHLGCVEIFVV